jgi:nucleoside permease NupC
VASSVHSAGYAAAGAINGDRRGQNWGAGGGWNDGTPGAFPDSLEIDFNAAYAIDRINVFSVQDAYLTPIEPTAGMTFTAYGLTAFDIEYWNGAAWATVPGGTITGNALVWRTVTFTPITTQKIRVRVNGALNTWSRITEVEAYTLMLSGYFPNIASHLITASVLSAPAAFIFAKVLVPETETPMTKGDVAMDVPVEDANIIDAAANGTTVGWQLAINVGAMLVSFYALVAMANWGIAWIGGFFHDAGGLLRFDAMAIAAVAALLYVEKRKPLKDATVWWMLLGLGAGVAALSGLGQSDAARFLALAGGAAWLPLFLQAGHEKGYGLKVWATVAGVAVVANLAFLVFGPLGGKESLSLQLVLGWLHWPVAFIMGVPVQDCLAIGKLLGEKLILTEFGAYLDLSNQMAAASRGEIPALDPRSLVIVSYALCGFANVASIGIQIGGIAPLAPNRRQDIARLGFKAMVGGALATFMLACVAGVFYTGRSMLGITGQ